MNIHKDYLDEKEAADYMCMGESTFKKFRKDLGIEVYRLPGLTKNIYKRSELDSVMAGKLSKWQPSANEENTGISNGQIQQDNIAKAFENMASQQKPKRKTTGSQKN